MIVNPDFLFFWYPESYDYNNIGQVEGPQPITRIFIFVILILVLYFTNFKKTINPNFAIRAFIFTYIYIIISSPSRSDSFSFTSVAIDQFKFSPIENFMQDTKRDFKTGYVFTPLGTFKMYKKENTFEDRLYRMENFCNENLEKDESKYCYDYPFK